MAIDNNEDENCHVTSNPFHISSVHVKDVMANSMQIYSI